MVNQEKIKEINKVIQAYFEKNTTETIVPAKNLMQDFIQAGIFGKDNRKGLPIRKVLRELDKENQLDQVLSVYAERTATDTYWYFIPPNSDAPTGAYKQDEASIKASASYQDKDVTYVIDLCDIVLGQKSDRQKRFDFLLGDLHKDGVTRTKLPVNAYYESLKLVIEYKEKHTVEDVSTIDSPDAETLKRIRRDKQRKVYDERRNVELPKNGFDLVHISYSIFKNDQQKKIVRNKEMDLKVVKQALNKYLVTD